MSEWIYVDEEMPAAKDEESSIGVLLWCGPSLIVSGWYDYNDGDWYDFINGEVVHDVAYWMLMPSEPL